MTKTIHDIIRERMSFYCVRDDCRFKKRGDSKPDKIRIICTKCNRSSTLLQYPIDFSTWTDIDKALDKQVVKYHLWKGYFDRLKAFHKEHNHTWVPKSVGSKLYDWTSRLRYYMRRNEVPELMVQLLESIDFKLNYRDTNDEATTLLRLSRIDERRKFSEQLKVVLAWKEKHNKWPSRSINKDEEEQELGRVISKWRIADTLYDDEMDILDKHNFPWNVNHQKFWEKIERVKAFKEKFGSYYLSDNETVTDDDRITSKLITDFRRRSPKAEWKLKAIKALNID